MRVKRAVGTLAGLALLVLAAEPAAAQTSRNLELINGLNLKLLYVAIPISILVEAILIYTVWKYKDSDEAQPTQENRRLEITWTVATAVILLFVGFAAFQVLGSPLVGGVSASTVENPTEPAVSMDRPGAVGPPASEENAVEVEVVAQKYLWEFNYVGRNVSSTGTLVVPADRPVYLHVTSTDWLHSFHVPKLGLKQDAFPGQYNTIKTRVYETGTYQLYCAEYCGLGHSSMLGTVEVKSPQAYQDWLDQQQSGGNASQTGGNATQAGNNSSAALAPAPVPADG